MTSKSNREAKYTQRRHPLLRLLISLVASGAVVVVLLTICGFLGRYWWRFEQACHFRIQYFWLLAGAAAVLLLARRRWLALAALAAAMVNGILAAGIYLPAEKRETGGSSVRLLSYNLLGRNQRHDDVLAYLRHEQADVVLLMEVQPHWAEQFERLRDLYPYQHTVTRSDNFGIALLSKTAWSDIETREFGSSEVPTIVAKFESEGGPWLFIGTHPVPPGSARAAAARNEQLDLVAQFAGRQSLPTVVAGDLNLTSFSPYFGDLLRTAALRDSRQGFGVQATWTPPLPLLEIPIDHCLASRQWRVTERRVGSHLGSDHRPVMATITLNKLSPRAKLPDN